MKKDVKFSTRMASTDREAIKELAKQSGMSMSDYVTACCLGKQVVVIDGLNESAGKLWLSSASQTTSGARPPDA